MRPIIVGDRIAFERALRCRMLERVGLAVGLVLWGSWLPSSFAVNPSNGLRIEVIAAPNFVVDSNVQTPASYSPRAAYLGATFYNDGTNDLTGITAYIGNYANGSGSTPGTYPSTNWAGLSGTFSLKHEGGSSGNADATRYIGTIKAGESVTAYWLVSYPLKDTNNVPVFVTGPNSADDLQLQYDIWITGTRAGSPVTANQRKTATMRNEISAMANKIFPNTANKVPQYYQDLLQKYAPQWATLSADGSPGTLVTAQGVWYDLGNVGGGYDINGDLVPDNDAWMQPVGDPSLFDSGALRLVHTYTLLIVDLKSGGELVITADDQLYFTGLPENNSVVGFVGYDFVPLMGGVNCQLTPYQEAASGKDNEKFNGDYGSGGVPPLTTTTSAVTLNKSASLAVGDPGQTNLYSIAFTNAGTQPLGAPELGLPLVIQDHVPTGVTYVAGSAASSNIPPSGLTNYSIFYSTNNAVSWTNAEPAVAANVTDIQWWLSGILETGACGVVRFSARINSPYQVPSPIIVNTGKLSFGSSAPFLSSTASTLVTGTNRLGDMVFLDNGAGGGYLGNKLQDGTEPGLSNILVYLYWDANTNGMRDSSDVLLRTAVSATNGFYIFTNLPDARYVAVVNTSSNVPVGYTITTPSYYSANLGSTNGATSSYTNADFGFAPALVTAKSLTSTNYLVEGRQVTYSLSVSNALPGDGTGVGTNRVYTTWARVYVTSDAGWMNPTNVTRLVEPDSAYASNAFSAAGTDYLTVRNFAPGLQSGSNVNVKIVIPLLIANLDVGGGTFSVDLQTGGGVSVTNRTFYTTNMTSGMFSFDITTATNNWSFLSDTNARVVLGCKKGVGNHSADIYVDAVGLRVTTDQIEGSSSSASTLDPVPMADSFNASFLQYLSATIPPTTVSTNTGTYPSQVGTLYWDNLGPLYPGGSKQVTVTFKALEPFNATSNTAAIVTNIQFVTNATFTGGASAGSFVNQVTNTLNPSGVIGDFIWRDVNTNGVQDGGVETGIANVKVVLTPPAGVDAGSGAGVAVTNTTDSSGLYYFEGITVWTNYTITVLTNTLPSGAFTNTFDADLNRNSQVVTNFNPLVTNGLDRLLAIDFGYRVSTTIDGTIWWDFNMSSNAVRDAGELWLTNVTVRLYTNATSFLVTNTDVNGYFSFSGTFTGSLNIVVLSNTGMMTNGTWSPTWDTDGISPSASTVTVSVVSGGTARGDFSYVKTGSLSLGDMVFYDWNGNGSQQTNEEGMAGIPISLYYDANSNGVVNIGTDPYIGSATTLSNGFYQFSGLATGNYIVVVDPSGTNLPNQVLCTADQVNPKDGISYLYLSASNTNQDFGFQPYGNGVIGDTVWRDLNGNGLQSGGAETGITNVPVRLYVDANRDGTYVWLAATNTDSLGQYYFSNLADALYRVVVDTASTNIPRDSLNIVYGATTPTTRDVTITNGNSSLTNDFGFAPFGAIGDTIFRDVNGNGIQDAFESGITGVVVTLYRDVNTNGVYDGGDTQVTSSVTSSNGLYLFSGLSTGRYVVVVSTNDVLANMTLTADPEADGLPVSQVTNAVAHDAQTGVGLNYGTLFMGADFGFQPPGVIGDAVWIDSNTNGVYDVGEMGIPNVPVVVFTTNGVAIATNRTDSNGNYGFGSLTNGAYEVRVLTNDAAFPAGLMACYDPDGTNDSRVVSIVISNGHIVSVGGVTRTNFDLSIDFGYRYAGTNALSGTVGLDDPSFNGLLGTSGAGVSSNEAPFANVQVYAYLWRDMDSNGVVGAGETIALGSTTTATNGDYSFTGLPDSLGGGTNYYIVSLEAPQDNLKLTTTTNATLALRINETTNLLGETVSAYQVLSIAAVITNIDFAFKSTVLYDFGDLPDVYGTLLQDNGARHVLATPPTLYMGAGVSNEVNGIPTEDASGDTYDDGVWATNVWIVATNGTTLKVQVGRGAGWLVGYVDFGQKGNFLGTNDMIISQAVATNGGTASNGLYTFVINVPSNAISSTTTTVLYARFRLFPGEPLIPELAFSGQADNGEVEDYRWVLGAIGNTVWFDANTNGVKDGSDYGLTNVTVFADLNGNGTKDLGEPSGDSNTNGTYGIGGLPPGTYTIRVDTNTLPAGVFPYYDADGWRDNVTVMTLTTGQVLTTINFGYYSSFISNPPSVAAFSISKTLISPTNRPSVVGEQQVFSITITNTGNVTLDTVPVTDAFATNLVSFISATPAPDATNAASLVWLNVGPLGAGAERVLTTRFAVVHGGVGTNTVWAAPTTNGVPIPPLTNSVVYTNIAPAISVVKTVDNAADGVVCYATNGQWVTYSYAITNIGDVALTNITAMDDKIGVLPAGFTLAAGGATNLTVTTNITVDTTNVVTVTGYPLAPDVGTVQDTDDAVVLVSFVGGTIGDFVWLDSNANGVQEVGEAGLSNVVVQLYGPATSLVASTVTGTNGTYFFTNVIPGSYSVKFVPPAGYAFVPQYQGGNAAMDSDADPVSGMSGNVIVESGSAIVTVDAGLYRYGTYALIGSVKGEVVDSRCFLVWETAGESGTAGFELWRKEETGEWGAVAAFLPAVGNTPAGAEYRFLDAAAVPGHQQTYRLIEIDSQNRRLDRGLWAVAFPSLAGKGNVLPAAAAEPYSFVEKPAVVPDSPLRATSSVTAPVAPAGTPAEAIKVCTDKEGIYGIGLADLAAAFGRPEQDMRDRLLSRGISVENAGRVVAARYGADGLLFFAERMDTRFTGQNVYIVRLAAGKAMDEMPAAAASPVQGQDFETELKVEQNRVIRPDLFEDPNDDMWLWRALYAGYSR